VIFDTIITTQYHAGNQAQQLLGFYIQGSGCIGVGIEVPEALDDEVVFRQDQFVHAGTVVVEFFNKVTHV
jgi:hypothetical protein